MHCYNVYASTEEVAASAADTLAHQIESVVRQNGTCRIALPGGTTPARCLELLAQKDLPWNHVHCFVGDERCLPVGDAGRNDTMIREKLWSRIDIPEANIHPVPAEKGARQAAGEYAQTLGKYGNLDIVVLGMGEDGHTASLFPGNAALGNGEAAVPVFDAPKPPPERVSLGADFLHAAQQRLILVTGTGKAEAMHKVREGEELPVNIIGISTWYLDEAASHFPAED